MSEIHLNSLEIRRFRCFDQLAIDKLGQVNLIVGRNSVGKTALLEAIRVFATRGSHETLFEILGYRNEIEYSNIGSDQNQIDLTGSTDTIIDSAIKYLFYGRHYELGDTFSIGSFLQKDQRLSIGIELYAEEQSELGKRLIGPISPKDYEQYEETIPRIAIYRGSSYRSSMPLIFGRRRPISSRRSDEDDIAVCQFVPATGLDIRAIATYWERISLTNDENEVITNLTKVVPNITGVNIVGFAERSPFGPFVIAKIDNESPVPLRSLGDGLYRAFGINLALVNARNGFLLIDEFETGLHHSVQTDIWRMILQTARRLNVQVFATTHSWDCVEAFQSAASEEQDSDATLIRLQNAKNSQTIEAEIYDRRLLGIATRQQVEVR